MTRTITYIQIICLCSIPKEFIIICRDLRHPMCKRNKIVDCGRIRHVKIVWYSPFVHCGPKSFRAHWQHISLLYSLLVEGVGRGTSNNIIYPMAHRMGVQVSWNVPWDVTWNVSGSEKCISPVLCVCCCGLYVRYTRYYFCTGLMWTTHRHRDGGSGYFFGV